MVKFRSLFLKAAFFTFVSIEIAERVKMQINEFEQLRENPFNLSEECCWDLIETNISYELCVSIM